MADFWNTDWLTGEMFAPLRAAGAGLPAIGWPDTALLNALVEDAGRIVNARGQQLRFVEQVGKPESFEESFEVRTFLKGEVQVRPLDWHDLFNALVWMTFPTAKAAINSRHYESMAAEEGGRRPPQRDALTLFDEDGIVVLSSDPSLLEMIREFRWRDLFWNRRTDVRENMRFFLFGHALYQKALDPFIGMTGKGILLDVPAPFFGQPLPAQIAETDRRLALHVWDRGKLGKGRDLAPVPVLGVPGWWRGNDVAEFYDNTNYFRSGRRSDPDQAPPAPAPSSM
jgi:hypothetical protein